MPPSPCGSALPSSKAAVVRLVLISDTHNRHAALTRYLLQSLPQNDMPSVLIHCGDFADRGCLDHVQSFCRWLASTDNEMSKSTPGLPSRYHDVVIVHGNHDIARPSAPPIDLRKEFDKCQDEINRRQIPRRLYYLCNQNIQLLGMNIHGVTWEASIQNDYSSVKNSPDVLISHVNPYIEAGSITDTDHTPFLDLRAWQGSRQLTQVATQKRIPLVLSGHVHWGRGVLKTKSGTCFVNASTTKPGTKNKGVDDEHEVTAPVVIDFEVPSRSILSLSCPSHHIDAFL